MLVGLLCFPMLSLADPINLAKNQAATASVVAIGRNYDGTCCGAYWADDGDRATHWSGYFAPAWWQVDLGSSQTVAQIRYIGSNNNFDLFVDGNKIASGQTTWENQLWVYDF